MAVVVVLALGYMVYAAFPGNALYFLTVDEFVNKSEVHDGRLLRVSGKLVDGSFQREERSTTSSFRLYDKELGAEGSQLDAQYVGVLPDLFFNPHSEIILEGSYSPEAVFHADSILVKCPVQVPVVGRRAIQRGCGGKQQLIAGRRGPLNQ